MRELAIVAQAPQDHLGALISALAVILYAIAVISALHAALHGRTSQGAIAWAVSLITFPYIALPLYWIFGRRKFEGYVEKLRAANAARANVFELWRAELEPHRAELPPELAGPFAALERLAHLPPVRGNQVELLIDGRAKFDALFAALREAQQYVLVQYYIVHDDAIGREMKAVLLELLARGVRVAFLCDWVGSFELSTGYVSELERAGAAIRWFRGSSGIADFQLNFRNHRKIVVVDGRVAFDGGINVGDEYLGRDAKFGAWRDTHVRVEGPLVQEIQVSFAADWAWADGPDLELEWRPQRSTRGDQVALALATGPADDEESCALFFLQACASAERRLWIATPYFVPDAPIFEALKLAAMRGVDVRVLLPTKADNLPVHLASFSFLPGCARAGVRVFRYETGFMHQKVLLVDDGGACVGSANLDNRSLRLNFESTVLVLDREFAREVEAMLARDFERSREVGARDFESRSWAFRAAVRTARLLEPVL